MQVVQDNLILSLSGPLGDSKNPLTVLLAPQECIAFHVKLRVLRERECITKMQKISDS